MTKWYRPWSTWGKSSRHLASIASMSLVHDGNWLRGVGCFVLSCLVTPSVKAEGASWWHFLAFVRTSEQAESQAMSCWWWFEDDEFKVLHAQLSSFSSISGTQQNRPLQNTSRTCIKGNLICTWEFTFFMKLSDLHMLMHILMLKKILIWAYSSMGNIFFKFWPSCTFTRSSWDTWVVILQHIISHCNGKNFDSHTLWHCHD